MSRRNFIRGAAGATALSAGVGSAAAQEGTGTGTGTGEGTGTAGGTGTATGGGGGGGGSATVAVGPDGDFVFTPGTDEPLYVTPGTTVTFVWESDNHNVVVDTQPSDASWSGHETIENTGFEFSYTFDVLGTYEYFCQPHQQQGMVGTIEVVESTPTATPAPAGPPEVPESAKSLGVAAFIAMCSTLGLAFFFTKYGGDYEPPEE